MSNQSPTPKPVTKKHIARLERERRQVALIRWIVAACIALVVAIIVYGYINVTYLQLGRPVAEVNGEKITTKQWQERVQIQRNYLLNQYQQMLYYQQSFGLDTTQQQQEIATKIQNAQVLGQEVLDQMVDEAVIRQQAERLGIVVTDQEVEEALQGAFNFYPNGTQTPTATATAFSLPTLSSQQLTLYPSTATPTLAMTSTLEPTGTADPAVTATSAPTQAFPTPTFVPLPATATSTLYTLEGFKESYAKIIADYQKDGVSEATIRSIYTADLLRQKVFDAVTADTPHTEEQVWARHILVSDVETALTVRTLLLNGEDFAKVAKDFSKDTGSANSGGDLGWFGKGMMVAEFEAAAFNQPVGEVGEAVQSQFGYHVIQVLGRAEVPLSANQYQQKREAEFSTWLENAKKESAILLHDEWREYVPTAPAGSNQ